MGHDDYTDAYLRDILRETRTIAMVGASADWSRPSYFAMKYLQEKGYRIVPVNPNETEVLGERSYPSLDDVPEDVAIDVVDVFRRAEHTPEIAEQAVRRGAKVLWLQDGIVNDDARRIGEEAGLTVIMGVCIQRTKRRLDRAPGGADEPEASAAVGSENKEPE